MMDDHDYYQPNYWGNGGRAAPEGDRNRGGYTKPVDYIRTIERVETGHNPDPFDPHPIDQGISVYYGAFTYGGVSFAILEDRKFKTGVFQGDDLDVYEGQLLGERQENFLRAWKDMTPELPKVVLTQTVWACSQTTPEGHPLIDFDSNGFPSYSRRTAVQLVKDCRALILSGDQHMASLLRHGIDRYDDGPLQFTGPAGGVGWQRWFEPKPLPNPRSGVPYSGDFVDGFGNKMQMLAIAQSKISFAEYRKHKDGRTQRIMDRGLKREGFGMVIIDARAGEARLECWPWNNAAIVAAGKPGEQYAGWPYLVKLTDL
jgi:alkaline phosphatase D